MSIGEWIGVALFVSAMCFIPCMVWGQLAEERRLREIRDEIREKLGK